jgi:hypothetical protein
VLAHERLVTLERRVRMAAPLVSDDLWNLIALHPSTSEHARMELAARHCNRNRNH